MRRKTERRRHVAARMFMVAGSQGITCSSSRMVAVRKKRVASVMLQ